MPIYEYACTICSNVFERLRPMSEMDEPANCPDCGSDSKRQLSVFLSFSTGANGRDVGHRGRRRLLRWRRGRRVRLRGLRVGPGDESIPRRQACRRSTLGQTRIASVRHNHLGNASRVTSTCLALSRNFARLC